jgi:hypothetical protein
MILASLALFAVMMLFPSQSTRVEPDPLSTYRWTHRLLVLHVPDTEAGRATLDAFRSALDDQRTDILDRDLLIIPVGDLPHAGDVLRPAVDLDAPDRLAVRRRLRLHGRVAQLVLIGKDGGVKMRQSGAFDLAGLLALIDSMPMRRAEAQRR